MKEVKTSELENGAWVFIGNPQGKYQHGLHRVYAQSWAGDDERLSVISWTSVSEREPHGEIWSGLLIPEGDWIRQW